MSLKTYVVLVALLAVQLASAQTECVALVNCAQGYEPYFSHYDESGCKIYGCRPTGLPSVSITIYASPQEVAPNSQVLVESRIEVLPGGMSQDRLMKFKIISSLSDEASLSGTKDNQILFASEGLIDKISSLIYGKVEPQKEEPIFIPEQKSISISSLQVAKQNREDYLFLAPGESTTISAYFNSGKPGNKFAEVKVYYVQEECIPEAQKPSLSCSTVEHQVGYSRALIRVTPESSLPPSPPTEFQQEIIGNLKVSKGWNMVSLPVDTQINMSKLASACGTADYAWSFSSSGYKKEEKLLPGVGYWIKATRDCTIDVSAPQYTLSINSLSQGWNLIGSVGRSVKISDYAGNCKITSGPWHYDSNLAGSANPYVYSSTLEPGKAYWVKVAFPCQLHSNLEEAPPSPPSYAKN